MGYMFFVRWFIPKALSFWCNIAKQNQYSCDNDSASANANANAYAFAFAYA